MEKLSSKTKALIEKRIKEEQSLAREFAKKQTEGMKEIYENIANTFYGGPFTKSRTRQKDLADV